ncbi:SGNH/GDSL hydrolase family protein [Anaeromicropila herbilytica]|uniref:Acetylxylan esterase n=1 Tax=Anaeromicropila herbilytica TaxID=2785025 RepID=A0A7R7IC82_9FIRM|nr:SGNH/GDSL hydrolase family protein [Anaeromicropila herbilytica]BCN30453.1 acetylxylan esterase [Anaeromicropila herbilytica]
MSYSDVLLLGLVMNVVDSKYFNYSGRIIKEDTFAYLGFTNSKVEFYVKSSSTVTSELDISFETKLNGEVNNARLRVMIDNSYIENVLVLDKQHNSFIIPLPEDELTHKITIIKITEAAMSYAKLNDITVINGTILPYPYQNDSRIRVEFIGDSITCGYGVYGEPDSEYDIKEEDGTVTYAALTADELNLNAQYFSVSGYGMYLKYDGDLEGVIPKIYSYTNYFIDQDALYNFKEFIPDLYVINLGTNDSGHLDELNNQINFKNTYLEFIKNLKNINPNAKILCIIGTLCTNVYPFINEVVQTARAEGITDIYTLELPYHDVEKDGMASGHPSLVSHQKDSKRLCKKIAEIFHIEY